jgi:hypothetical protein
LSTVSMFKSVSGIDRIEEAGLPGEIEKKVAPLS